MREHWLYLRYVVRHKWFVWQEGRKLGVGRLQLLKHDWSKFLPSEWKAYTEYFYGSWRLRQRPTVVQLMASGAKTDEEIQRAFDAAWLKHQHRNKHHWQYWVLREDSGDVKVLEMPPKYRAEMLADWRGAGRAILGDKANTVKWYSDTVEGRQLAAKTKEWVEKQLAIA